MKFRNLMVFFVFLLFAFMFLADCQSPEITSAKVYFQQNNIDAAEEQLLVAQEKEPQNAEIPYLLATGVYTPRKDWNKAKEMLLLSKELDPAYKDKANDQLKRIWGELHTEGASYFNDALRALFPQEKDSLLLKAADKFKEALEILQNEALTYNGIVKAYYQLNDTANVEKYAKMSIENGIFDKDIMFFYTQVLWQPERQEEVLQYLADIVAEHPDAFDLKLLQVQFLTELERYDDALLIAKQLVDQNPDNQDLKFVLAQIYAKTDNLTEAQYLYRQILVDNPNDMDVLIRIAEAAFNSKDWVMAEEYARKIIDLDENSLFGVEILWKSIYNQGRKDEAEKWREIAKGLR